MKKIGLGLMIAGIAAVFAVRISETAIIVQLGIQVFSVLSILPFAVIAVGLAVFIVGALPTIRARLAAQKKQAAEVEESKTTLPSRAASYEPEDIRHMLVRLKEQRSDLAGEIAKCEEQMNAMDRRQERLKQLLDLNEVEYLRSTEQLLNEVEQFICKNFRKVINRGIVTELDDDNVFARDDKYSTYAELIKAVLTSNQIELDKIKKFLADIADLVSEQDDNTQATLEAWMQVIRDSLKREEI